jgi:hypothetical protein
MDPSVRLPMSFNVKRKEKRDDYFVFPCGSSFHRCLRIRYIYPNKGRFLVLHFDTNNTMQVTFSSTEQVVKIFDLLLREFTYLKKIVGFYAYDDEKLFVNIIERQPDNKIAIIFDNSEKFIINLSSIEEINNCIQNLI